MNKTQVINYIRQSQGAEIAELQKRFAITYKEAKSVVDELITEGNLSYAGGVRYKYVAPFDFLQDEESRPYLVRGRGNFPRSLFDEDDEEEDDEDDEDVDDSFEALERYMEENSHLFDEIEEFEEQFKEQSQRLADVVSLIAGKKSTPITADVIPMHPSWSDEDKFTEAVMERMERLIKSDKKMGVQGAIKKAETYLEAVRDTVDRKAMQVYERLVYELKNTSAYLYGQLKKQFIED